MPCLFIILINLPDMWVFHFKTDSFRGEFMDYACSFQVIWISIIQEVLFVHESYVDFYERDEGVLGRRRKKILFSDGGVFFWDAIIPSPRSILKDDILDLNIFLTKKTSKLFKIPKIYLLRQSTPNSSKW